MLRFSREEDRDKILAIRFYVFEFDDKINRETVFIAHNDINYDSHCILSYLVENTEHLVLLANDGNIL